MWLIGEWGRPGDRGQRQDGAEYHAGERHDNVEREVKKQVGFDTAAAGGGGDVGAGGAGGVVSGAGDGAARRVRGGDAARGECAARGERR